MFSARAPIAAKQINVNILGGVELLRNFEKTKLFIRNGYIGSRGLSSDAKWQTYTIARKLIFLN
jgi:hypothetical protein